MKTLLITGGSGFIGKNIKEHFNEAYNVLSPSHQELDLLSEQSVYDYFHTHNINYVIHCAATGLSRKKKIKNIVTDNTRMYFNLTTHGIFEHMYHMGSGAEYDKSQSICKVSEDDFGYSIPKDDYGYSKYLISKSTTDRRCTTLRLFGVFGKYEDCSRRFISNSIIKNILGQPIIINQNVVFDWIYINDLTKILSLFIGSPPSEYPVYNVTPTESVDLLTIANLINKQSKNKSEIIIKNKGMSHEYTGDNSRLMKRFKNPIIFTPMKNAISELIQYYERL